MNEIEEKDEKLFFNGINGEDGSYDLPPMTAKRLAQYIKGEPAPDNLSELKHKHERQNLESMGVAEGVDPRKLDSAGWGIIFAQAADPDVEEALSDLIALRKQQAGEFFKIYKGSDGYRSGESKNKWMTRNGASPGPAQPENMPYYLLIVGSPQEIPYRFQTQLDVQYAVGRIHFETLDEYANYAASVVKAESSGGLNLPRRVAFFGAVNGDDKATNLTTDDLVVPLGKKLQEKHKDWDFSSFSGKTATKENLTGLLGGEQTPSLLFTGSHGLALPRANARQLAHQGALICSEWPGPDEWAGMGPIPQDHFFAGDDLTEDSNLLGQIAFFFACYGAGTPLKDEFRKFYFKDKPAEIASHPFLADLPKQMLNRPAGGALAVVSHVERAWSFSYRWPNAGVQTEVFRSSLSRLLKGYPVGSAFEFFDERYAELSTVLSDQLDDIDAKVDVDEYELAFNWTANNDAKGYVIIGDPAVKLSVAEEGTGETRPTVTVTAGPSTAGDGDEPDETPAPTEQPPRETEARPSTGSDEDIFSMGPPPGLNLPKGYREEYPELYEAWSNHIRAGYEYNDQVFRRILDEFLGSHRATLYMYWIVFAVGIGAFVAAVVMGILGQSVTLTAVFAGLSVVSFVTYFIGRPTQSVEENLQFITWLGVIYNSYWTHLFWASDPKTAQAELDKATEDAIRQLKELNEQHGKAVKGRPNLKEE